MVRILIIDPEDAAASDLIAILADAGHTVIETARSAGEALAVIRREPPDLILMNHSMADGAPEDRSAAEQIFREKDIPVIFIAAHQDDKPAQQENTVQQYQYIARPFAASDVETAIQTAMNRRQITIPRMQSLNEYLIHLEQEVPESRAVLLNGFFSDITLFFYSRTSDKAPLFIHSLSHGITIGELTVYGYYQSCIGETFLKDIVSGNMMVYNITKKGIEGVQPFLNECCDSITVSRDHFALRFLFDFSMVDDFSQILAIKSYVLNKRDRGFPVSGVFAFSLGAMNRDQMKIFSQNIPRVVVSGGDEMLLSFSENTYDTTSVEIVSRDIMENIVKKSLEPIVLSFIQKNATGNKILQAINDKYHIFVPQSRVYSMLYELEKKGIVKSEQRGKMKTYHPTREGQKYIEDTLNEFQAAYRHIFGGKKI